MESPSPTHNNPCFNVCNNNLLPNYNCQIMPIDTVDNVSKTNTLNNMSKHPGQAIKIITESTGEHKIIKENKKNMKEVCKKEVEDKSPTRDMKVSKSCSNVYSPDKSNLPSSSKSSSDIKSQKSCDENLIKFIFTKHGIQVISDVETIV